ncbi:hypothetical protein [Thermaerobacter marianensis]|nr:hypothetical protein [Thermaerobacter marianensis]
MGGVLDGAATAGVVGPAGWAAVLGTVLLAVALGYAAGRRRGYRDGYRLGRAEAPLELRAQALTRGVCPVCDHVAAEAFGCGGERPDVPAPAGGNQPSRASSGGNEGA